MYSVKISFKHEGEIKIFSDGRLMDSRISLKEILKGVIQADGK